MPPLRQLLRQATRSDVVKLVTVQRVVVMEAQRKAERATLCGDQEQIRQAPVFIAWCADRSRLERACQQRGYKQNVDYMEAFLVVAVDVGLVMQNATLAAESLGLGGSFTTLPGPNSAVSSSRAHLLSNV